MSSTQLSPEMEALKGRMKATWEAGDFGVIARSIAQGAVELVDRLGIGPGMNVLDVACGSGNTALPEARNGASVTGIDIAENLIEQAKANAAREGLDAKFEVGDAEDMPYEDGSFDVVVTMFGAMFAPRPDVTASELKRVCKSGGLIAMANWTPQGFAGQMFKIGGKHVPPPPGIPPPVMWGDEDTVRERFADGISDLELKRIPIMFHFDMPPNDVVEHFRKYFGPTQVAFSKLDEAGQAALRAELVELWTSNNRATDGTTEVESEYLEVRATKA
ncbi:MAG TPA: methyltransferase domain-containing protein [Pyrinomonadaceae bacterium]|jgi:SAM-dependent methyltransferase|nr:methyltransferase domain-containing protein [Pyrinomonadaceae bacterium]